MQKINKIFQTATLAIGVCAIGAAMMVPAPAAAQGIIDDWWSAKTPNPPELKPVTVNPADTALLMLDFVTGPDKVKANCGTGRPRCGASLPHLQKLLAAARAAGVMVVYSTGVAFKPTDISTMIAPRPGDPVVKAGPDKFVGTDLDKILAAKNIKTVIVTGTTAEGAVLDTASDAVFRGMSVILPVDGMSAVNPYAEQYVAWHMANGPTVGAKTTVTSIDKIKF